MNRCPLPRWAIAGVAAAIASAAPAAIDPADYGTILYHADAGDLALNDGDPVGSWGSPAAAGTERPTYVASDPRFNSRPAVRFDGSDDVLRWTGANLSARTIFAAVTLESTAKSLDTLISTGADKLNVRRNNTTAFYRSAGQGADQNDFSNITPAGELRVNDVISGGYSYGVSHLVVAAAGANQTYSNFWIGSASDGLGRHWTGSVAEIIVFGGTLDAEGMNAVGRYFQDKYALPTNFDPVTPDIASFTAAANGADDTGILIPAEGEVELRWTVENADTVAIDNGALDPAATLAGSVSVNVAATTTFTLTATNAQGGSTAEVTVYVGAPPGEPRINEFLAENDGGLRDEDGESSDWIEIYNPNPFALDLSAYELTDGTATWAIPAGTFAPAGGYFIVFASGKDRTDPGGELHASFALQNGGEYLALRRISDGAVLTEFAPEFPEQFANRSYGYFGDPAELGYFAEPTPGAENGATGLLGFLDLTDDTQFQIGRGFFETPFNETITCATPGATIIYTLDGSTPSLSEGTQVPAPDAETPPTATVLIDGSLQGGVTTLRAAVFKDGYAPTNTDTQTYIFALGVTGQQPANATASGWPAGNVNGQQFNYGMRLDNIGPGNSAIPAAEVAEALQTIPTVSIVTDIENLVDPTIGLYVNADVRGDQFERPASMELIFPPDYIDPDGNTDGFQIDFGLRIRGGASRGDSFFKHSFRCFFRREYGAGKLRYRLFGDEGTDEFDKVDFRTSQNYDWARESSFNTGRFNTLCREVWTRDTQGAMGQPHTKSRYYHLYLNGTYWGIYMTEERPEESFGASYFGGDPDDYDVPKINRPDDFKTEATSGNLDAWHDFWQKAIDLESNPTAEAYWALQGLNPDGSPNPALPIYLDPDNMADYLICLAYQGDGDTVLSSFLGFNRPNNWYAVRNRVSNDMGFTYYLHDGEHSLGSPNSVVDHTGPYNGSNRYVIDYANTQWIHEYLTASPEYRLAFADRVHRHMFNGGVLETQNCIDRFNARAAQIREAIKAYAARWGDARYATGYTTQDWENAITFVNNWFPGRREVVLGQLRADGLYPDTEAPVYQPQHGGSVPAGFSLAMDDPNAAGGVIYYTLDGSDPRNAFAQPVVTQTYVAEGGTWQFRVPSGALDGFSLPTLSATPVAYFPFDADASDAATADGAQDGTLTNGAAITTADSVFGGGALQLDGLNDCVLLGDPAALQITGPISIAAWAKRTGPVQLGDTLANIVAKGYQTTPSSGEIMLRYGSAGVHTGGSWDGGNHVAESASGTDLNTWVHLCAVYTGSEWRLYQNGQLAATTVDATGAVPVAMGWAIGSRGDGTSRFFPGLIDEVYLFDTAITEADVRALAGYYQADWAAPAFDDAAWSSDPGGVGYAGNGDPLEPFIQTDVGAEMIDASASLLMRSDFTIGAGELAGIDFLALDIRYDDGFIAYLNGVEVARRNAPPIANGLSAATVAHADPDAIIPEKIDLSAQVGLLQEGGNVLAIHGLNSAPSGQDFLIEAKLTAGNVPAVSSAAQAYGGAITLAAPTQVNARVFKDGEWSALNSAFYQVDSEPASDQNLVVAALHYHPASDAPLEYLLFQNIGSEFVDLSGVIIRDGVDFAFPDNTVIAPGAQLALAQDPAALAPVLAGYDIIGPYSGRLNNDGERLHITAANGDTIRDFTYNDAPPWPGGGDQGYPLILIAPGSNPDHSDPFNWRSAAALDLPDSGTPFAGDPLGDADGNGVADIIDYAVADSGTPLRVAFEPFTVDAAEDTYLVLEYTRPIGSDDAIVTPQIGSDLLGWSSAPEDVVFLGSANNGDGTETFRWRSAAAVGAEDRLFGRLSVTPR
ncbi:MAG: lamin tail domain-containing protein [Verrucomicrobiales bacterium]